MITTRIASHVTGANAKFRACQVTLAVMLTAAMMRTAVRSRRTGPQWPRRRTAPQLAAMSCPHGPRPGLKSPPGAEALPDAPLEVASDGASGRSGRSSNSPWRSPKVLAAIARLTRSSNSALSSRPSP
jgi:hypothetical protein